MKHAYTSMCVGGGRRGSGKVEREGGEERCEEGKVERKDVEREGGEGRWRGGTKVQQHQGTFINWCALFVE